MMLFIGITMPILGLALLGGAVFSALYRRRNLTGRKSAEGEVIELVRRGFNPGSPGIYCPVVRFRAPDGEEYEFESEHGSRPAMHKVGQTVTVLYDPADPENAEIRSALTRWLVPGLMIAIGLFFMCGGCMVIAIHFMILGAGAT